MRIQDSAAMRRARQEDLKTSKTVRFAHTRQEDLKTSKTVRLERTYDIKTLRQYDW